MPFRLAFAVSEIGPEAAAGDYFTALELGSALQARFGWLIEYLSKDALGDRGWYDLVGIDLLIVMVDEYELPAIRQASSRLITIAWTRNWFERWCERPWITEYDLHLASSRRAAGLIAQRSGKLASLLRIATNPTRFNSEGRPSYQSLDYVFTGHFWQTSRDIVDALLSLPPHYRGAIYGKNWEQVPALAHLHHGFVPYEQIHEVYRQAVIVIDDANHVTKAWGAANSRVFDALAAGCLVITNSRSVSDEVFSGRLPVYENPQDLGKQLEYYLKHKNDRNGLLEDLRGVVLARHTYTHRAIELGLHLRSSRKFGINLSEALTVSHVSLPIPHTQEASPRQPKPLTTKKLPTVSFLVPLYNHLSETREMWTSLQSSLPEGLGYEIIFVDDASTDGTATWLNTLRDPRIKVLINEVNRGYAATINAGARHATGELLVLLNNDLLFESGWLEPMLHVLLSPELKAGLVGNVQYRIDNGELDHTGVELSAEGTLVHIRAIPPQNQSKALAVTGACMLLRKADFDMLGGFDEAFVNGCEDIDLCFKLRAAGKEIYLASQSHIRHHVSLSRKTSTQQDLLNSRRLFGRWRQEIKRELSDVWRRLIQAGSSAYCDKLSGELDAEFITAPYSASQVIAEAMLRREESYWRRMLDDVEVDLEGKLGVQGLLYSTEHGAQLLKNLALFSIDRIDCARNFYVCGQRIDDLHQPVTLTIRVNGLQTLETVLKAERDINVGIIDPLLLPGVTNTFQIVTNQTILLTHLVIDDRVIDLR